MALNLKDLFTAEDIANNQKLIEKNSNTEKLIDNNRREWSDRVAPLFENIKNGLSENKIGIITEDLATALSYKMMISEEINETLNRRSKTEINLNKVKAEKLLFLSTGFGLKTTMAEKQILIDHILAYYQHRLDLLDNYVDFIRSISKTLDSYQFQFKNLIDYYNYLK